MGLYWTKSGNAIKINILIQHTDVCYFLDVYIDGKYKVGITADNEDMAIAKKNEIFKLYAKVFKI
mgnify:CR=1 FL=1